MFAGCRISPWRTGGRRRPVTIGKSCCGSWCGTRSITGGQPGWATGSWPGRGSATPRGSSSNGTRLGDGILARTWVGDATRIKFERHTELRRASDGCLLAKARTVWCPIDAVTGKPTGVSAAVRAAFSVRQKGEEDQPQIKTDEDG